MNREIKFRVWNGQEMEYNIMAGFLGAFYVQGIDEKFSASMSPFNTKYSDNTPIMQFTGVLDKNGKEIYEGDIIKYTHYECFPQDDEISENILVEWVGNGFRPFNYLNETAKTEVIGNIYENPKLLGESVRNDKKQ